MTKDTSSTAASSSSNIQAKTSNTQVDRQIGKAATGGSTGDNNGSMVFPWLLTFFVTLISLGLFIPPHLRGVEVTCDNDPPIDIPLSLLAGGDSNNDKADNDANANIFAVNPCQVYSLSYTDARAKFRQSVKQLQQFKTNIELHTLPIYTNEVDEIIEEPSVDTNVKGNEQEFSSASVPRIKKTIVEYTTDIAIIPGSSFDVAPPPPVVIHASGLHGVEGYAGSAIQLSILNQMIYIQQLQQQLYNVGGGLTPGGVSTESQQPTIVLIHAINPYGMYHFRRPNENNIDLNRNAILRHDDDGAENQPSPSSFTDASGSSMDNSSDPSFHKILQDFKTRYEEKPTYYDITIGHAIQTIKLLTRYGYNTLKRVIVTGQYADSTAPFYGGTSNKGDAQVESSLQHLFEFLTKTRPSLFKSTKVLIDVHTGLGPFGKDTISLKWNDNSQNEDDNGGNDSVEQSESHHNGDKTLEELFPSAYDIVSPVSNEKGAMSGYENAKGFVTAYLEEEQNKLLSSEQKEIEARQSECQAERQERDGDEPKQCSLPKPEANEGNNIFMVQEFGTLPGILVARALILENWINQYLKMMKTDSDLTLSQQRELYGTKELGMSLTRGAFYPQSTKWRRDIVQRGVKLFQHAVDYAINSSTEAMDSVTV